MLPLGVYSPFWVNKTSIARTASKGDIMSIKNLNTLLEEALDDGDIGRAGYYAELILENEKE